MITREEYEASMKKVRTIRGAITPMANYIDSLEKHIKELESKLSCKTEQLTCEDCKHRNFENFKKCGGGWCGTCYIGKTENNHTKKGTNGAV